MASAVYDQIGIGYAKGRQPDPRWQRTVDEVIGSAQTIVNVGAGTGSYEPSDRRVLAVEPSSVMIKQRPAGAAPAIRGAAEHLPFAGGQFEVAMAVSTLHHWNDWTAGIAELRRVASRAVVLHFDPSVHDDFWLVGEYLPELSDVWRDTPSVAQVVHAMGPGTTVRELPVPWDCEDGFLSAFWRRPVAYLDSGVRACMSGLQALEPAVLGRGIEALRNDLRSGTWQARHADLLERDHFDGGWRLIFHEPGTTQQ